MMNNLIKKLFPGKKLNRSNPQISSSKSKASEKHAFKLGSSLPYIMGILLIMFIVLLFPRGKSYEFGDLKEGDVYIGDEVIAPFTFPINKSEEDYNRDIEEAKKRIYPVFVRNDSIAEYKISLLKNFFLALKDIRDTSKTESVEIEAVSQLLKSFNIIISDDNLFSLLHDGESHVVISPKRKKAKSSGENIAFDKQIIHHFLSITI